MRVHVEVWSDYLCPFCYLEEPVLERLKTDFGDQIKIKWRAFELRPAPVPTLEPNGAYLRDIWARAVYPMAKDRGMTLRLPPVQPRSRSAHEAAQFAAIAGLCGEMNTALFKAFFEDGRDIGQRAVLIEIGTDIGLKGAELQKALEDHRHQPRVLADEQLALELGISGVPALLFHREGEPLDGALEVSGAQSYESVRSAVDEFLIGVQ